MIYASEHTRVRWAEPDGPLAVRVPDGTGAVEAACGSRSVAAVVSGGVASVTVPALLMPELGAYVVEWSDDSAFFAETPVERVSARYCTVDDLISYGRRSNDGFEDSTRYPRDVLQAAVQAAEEAIEGACGRCFCTRRAIVNLRAGSLVELPFVDVSDVDGCELVTDRQASVPEAGSYAVTYGTEPDASVRRACVQLAAWYARPKAMAENARGQSIDGVFVGFELATGTEGSWTGLPEVDAFIERRRSRRLVIM